MNEYFNNSGLGDIQNNAPIEIKQGLVSAMEKEQSAHEKYSRLFQEVENEELRHLNLFLAEEERRHKSML